MTSGKKAFVAGVCLALLSAAVFASTTDEAAPLGEWSGTVTQIYQDGSQGSYPTTMTISSSDGKLGGVIRYPSLKCGGSLTFIRRVAGTGDYEFRETIEDGKDRCVDGGFVRVNFVKALDDTIDPDNLTWAWYFPDGRFGAIALLSRAKTPKGKTESIK